MSGSRLRRVLDRLPSTGARRPELSLAAYRSAFDVENGTDED
ncbi:MAG: hypothetical protein ABEH59_06215 [Halobacteriales archaeon]